MKQACHIISLLLLSIFSHLVILGTVGRLSWFLFCLYYFQLAVESKDWNEEDYFIFSCHIIVSLDVFESSQLVTLTCAKTTTRQCLPNYKYFLSHYQNKTSALLVEMLLNNLSVYLSLYLKVFLSKRILRLLFGMDG